MKKFILTILIFLSSQLILEAKNSPKNLWQITFYCACKICCGKYSDGITASGFPLTTEVNIAANNFLLFGARVRIKGLGEYIILDRGAVKYFGRKEDKIKHIDIYTLDHKKALELGSQYREVIIK